MVAQPSPIPTRIGPFVIHGRIGAGGMGAVYRGISPAAERVAVKVILPGLLDDQKAKDRFAGEVHALKTVSGPRVALLIDADPEAADPWLAVQYVHGPDLDKYVKAHGPLPPELVAILGAVLAEGLGSVHKAGLLHRDLKPSNILLGPDGPVVIDFGLAVLIERRQVLTATGIPMGTAACMSPEQARAEKALTEAADVYGLAATLLYAATGRYPYDAPGYMPMLVKIADRGQLPNLDGVPESLRPLLAGMLQYDPLDRPSLGEVTGRLIKWLERQGLTAVAARARLVDVTTAGLPPLPDLPAAAPPVGSNDETTDRARQDATTVLLPAKAAAAAAKATTAATPGARTRVLPDRDAASVVADRLGAAYGRRRTLRHTRS